MNDNAQRSFPASTTGRQHKLTDKQRIDAMVRGKIIVQRDDFDDGYTVLGPELKGGGRHVYEQSEYGSLRKTIDAAIHDEASKP
jgi:hypothetical protein